MKTLVAIITVGLIFTATAEAAPLHHEKEYQNKWCVRERGQVEFPLADNIEIDCLTDQYAVEVAFAENWAQAVGRARFYSVQTGRDPGVLLIMENIDRDFKYLVRLLTTINDDNRLWRVWVIKPEDL